MRVSMIQMPISDGEPAVNQAAAERWLLEALACKPDVIVLPELWNTGYALPRLAEIADREGQTVQSLIGGLAKAHGVVIVAGSVAVQERGNYYNTCYVFDRQGRCVSKGSKVHLFDLMGEKQYLTAGDQIPQFALDGVPAASAICYDIRFPEWIRTLMARGPQLLFVPAQWPRERIDQWEILLRARAVENQAYVVAVNRVGIGRAGDFCGRSMVIGPDGQVLVQAPDDAEGVFTADLDFSRVRQMRRGLPVFADRRPDLYE